MLLYQKIRETDDLDNWYIELYEKFPCNDKKELHKREGEVIREIGTLNINIAGRDIKQYNDDTKEKRKEYYEDNKEKISEKSKQYREKNKDHISEYKKRHYEQNKEKINQYYKQWREDNIDHKKQMDKQYYQQNKEKLNQQAKEKKECECGSIVRKGHYQRHLTTQKHQKYMESLLE